MTVAGSPMPSISRQTILIADLPMEVVSTGLRYLIVPVRPGALARARISRDITELLHGANAQFAVLLDETAVEVRHWNNDGIIEDVATGSAAGTIGAYRLRHGLVRGGDTFILNQGQFTGRPSKLRVLPEGDANRVETVKCGRRCVLRRTRHDRGTSMTVVSAETIRASVTFEDLIEPLAQDLVAAEVTLAKL